MNTLGASAVWCGGYVLAVIFFVLASRTLRRLRLTFSILAWLATIGYSCFLYMVIEISGLAHMQGEEIHAYVAMSRAIMFGIVLALGLAAGWSCILFRKRRPEQQTISVSDES